MACILNSHRRGARLSCRIFHEGETDLTRRLRSTAALLTDVYGTGWLPYIESILEAAAELDAIATETRSAETENTGSVGDEGAGPKDIAQ